jgi:hypothetical protein
MQIPFGVWVHASRCFALAEARGRNARRPPGKPEAAARFTLERVARGSARGSFRLRQSVVVREGVHGSTALDARASDLFQPEGDFFPSRLPVKSSANDSPQNEKTARAARAASAALRAESVTCSKAPSSVRKSNSSRRELLLVSTRAVKPRGAPERVNKSCSPSQRAKPV